MSGKILIIIIALILIAAAAVFYFSGRGQNQEAPFSSNLAGETDPELEDLEEEENIDQAFFLDVENELQGL